MEGSITYFETPGRDNTDAVMEIVKNRAQELEIKTVVVTNSVLCLCSLPSSSYSV
jgi:hypothetical protein